MSKQKCRLVVHANRENSGWHGPILYVDGAHLQVDVEECGWNTGELSHSLPRIAGAGLWIFEGIEVVSECGYPDPPEVDVEYYGKWRRPTDDELERIARGGAPWESDSDELRPQVSLSRAAFDMQWDALVECSADELDVSALPHRRALCAIGSTADVAYERLCTLLRLFNGHFEVTGPDADAFAMAWEEGAEAAFDAQAPSENSDYLNPLYGRALDEFYASNPYRTKGVGDE